MPAWHGKIWKADHTVPGVVRRQAGEQIACTDPRFSRGYWLEREDFISFVKTLVLSCREWDQEVELISLEAFARFFEGPK